jgi:hypothetical protein
LGFMLGNTGNWNTQKRLAKAKWHQAVEVIDECVAEAPDIKVHTHWRRFMKYYLNRSLGMELKCGGFVSHDVLCTIVQSKSTHLQCTALGSPCQTHRSHHTSR